MKHRLLWMFTMAVCALLLALLLQAPQWRHMQSPLFRGVAVQLNSDEEIYLARIQEALSGRPEQAAEAFTGHPNLQGTQFALLERLYGTAFRFTGWRASQVLTFLDVIVPVLVFGSLIYLFTLCGFSRRTALVLAGVFCLLQLYNLNRPIHMRSSFLVMLWAIIWVRLAVMRGGAWVFPAGIMLGLLVGVYVWSFMFAWAVWGVYFVWELGEWLWAKRQKRTASHIRRLAQSVRQLWWYVRPRKPSWQLQRWHTLAFIGVVGLVAALPFVAKYVMLQSHPLYEFGSFRSGMHPGRAPESLAYSGIFLVATACILMALRRQYDAYRPYRFVFVLLFAAVIYMNQQAVHGITFNFVSHGIFSLLLAALAVIGLAVLHRDVWLRIGAGSLLVYVLAVGYDGRYVIRQWTVDHASFAQQHLAEALPILDALPRGRFVSDPNTMAFLAGNTHHDVVYSVYLKNVLMTHSEIAMRYCLTQIPLPPAERTFTAERNLVMPDAVSAFKGDTRVREIALVEAACRQADLDPALALEAHEVGYVFWNKRTQSRWNVLRFGVNLEEVAAGEGWVLYRVLP